MKIKDLYEKFNMDSETEKQLSNIAEDGFDAFAAMAAERFPSLSKDDLSSLFDEFSDGKLDLDDLSAAAGGLKWKKHIEDPDKPKTLR